MKLSRQNRGRVLTLPTEDASRATLQLEPAVSDSDISRRAYERFLDRGAEHGHDLDDWLEAERELRQSPTSQVA
jgi:hypothetical protein